MKKELNDGQIDTLAVIAASAGLEIDFEESGVYCAYFTTPRGRRVGFTDFEAAMHYLAGYIEAQEVAKGEAE